MYSEQITYKCMSRVISIFSFTLGCTLLAGSMQPAHAETSTEHLFPVTGRFDLLAGDGGFSDDCDTATGLAAGDNGVIMLAKLDGQKTRATGKGKNGGATAPAADVEQLPAALPQSPTAPDAQETWEIIVSDKTLNAALARWASKAGWQLVWELPVDYAVETRTTVHGSFEEAVGAVTRGMESAEIPMKAMFYQGNKVLRITAKGAE